jgi:hypothetical protein
VTTINQKLGLKARTTTRKATHARSLVTNAKCPACDGRHVIENEIHGVLKRMCGSCSHIWVPESDV